MSRSEYNRAYYAARKTELAAAALARYHANPEAWKAANTAWRKANPEKSKARNRASWRRHREKRIRETVENGRKNPSAKVARSQAYRARKRKAEGRFSADEFRRVIESQGGRCFYCAVPISTPVAEHVIPLVRGGSNRISNIVASCASCNCKKSSKTLEEFRPDLAMHFQATQ